MPKRYRLIGSRNGIDSPFAAGFSHNGVDLVDLSVDHRPAEESFPVF
jgi:hypothetical protein